ncbi:MAG: LysE family translocator [Rhodoferax sp.]|nr:LysE family translocator [Rhodoferax sp.]MBP7574631.1 LysE family translocator [Rhodoferax sp.]MBP8136510.1 LysE family translocator [Rhodoferax sp.]
MTLTTYFIYLAAVALLVVTPGPTMLMSMTNAATYGTAKALMSTAGSVTAVLGVMILSSMGLGAVLAASNTAFTVLKVVGAAYLIYLGITTFLNADRAVLATASPLAPTRSARSLYLQGWMVGASNPKALLFFSAFFPQFIDPQAAFVPQFAILASTFIAIEFSVLSLCCVFTARLAPWLRESGRTRAFNRVSGSLFAGMGALLLLMRRPS